MTDDHWRVHYSHTRELSATFVRRWVADAANEISSEERLRASRVLTHHLLHLRMGFANHMANHDLVPDEAKQLYPIVAVGTIV